MTSLWQVNNIDSLTGQRLVFLHRFTWSKQQSSSFFQVRRKAAFSPLQITSPGFAVGITFVAAPFLDPLHPTTICSSASSFHCPYCFAGSHLCFNCSLLFFRNVLSGGITVTLSETNDISIFHWAIKTSRFSTTFRVFTPAAILQWSS